MRVISKSMYRINNEEARIETRDIPETFNNFLEGLISHINENTSVRKYKPRKQTTQVVNLVRSIITNAQSAERNNNTDENNFGEIADRLLQSEFAAQERVDKLGIKIKRGSLVQALVQDENAEATDWLYLIAKVEHSEWIDDADLLTKIGFSNSKKSIWKSCIFECSYDGSAILIGSAKIYVDGTTKYWHDLFLELDEMVNDEVNTKHAFEGIDNLLKKAIKKKSPHDYLVLRNSVIGHFRTKKHIDYNLMVDEIFSNYVPSNLEKKDIEVLKEKLNELPSKKEFDRQFNSMPHIINAKIRTVYTINQSIELKLLAEIDNIGEIIQAVEETDGTKYIKIRSGNDETFNAFKSEK